MRIHSLVRTLSARAAAFTLIEIMVSMAVLVLILLTVVQIVNSTSRVTGLSQQQIEMDNQARSLFERMGRDFDGMVRRPDVDCNVYPYNPKASNTAPAYGSLFKRFGSSGGGNDYLAFVADANAVTAVPGAGTAVEDNYGLVAYRIWDNTSLTSPSMSPYYSIERFGVGTGLKVPAYRGLLFLSSTIGKGSYLAVNPKTPADITAAAANIDTNTCLRDGMQLPDPHVQNASFHCVGDEVFRLEFALQLKYPHPTNATILGPYYRESPNPANQQLQDMRDVTAVVATIALVPKEVRTKLAGNFNLEMAKAVAALKDGNTPAVANDWELALRTNSAIHPLIAQNARVYQRFFYLK